MYGVFENTKKIPVHIMNCDEFESFMYNWICTHVL